MRTKFMFLCGTMLAALVFVTGCNSPKSTSTGPSGTKTADAHGDDDHSHGAGPHGGTIFDIGGGKYHGEFTVDHKTQEATLYILDGSAKRAAPIQSDKILLSIKDPSFQVDLLPMPQSGETSGKCSRFVGKHEKLGKEQEFAGSISCQIDGKAFAGDFKEEAEGHDKK